MGNRLFQESRARNCQEIEELRRICCEETDRAKNSWPAQQNFKIRKQRAALECPTFPANHWISRVPEVCSGAILDCRSIFGMLLVLQERTCSRGAILSYLREFTEFGIFFLRIDMRKYYATGESNETRAAEFFNTNATNWLWSWNLETFCVILEELILTLVWWMTRDIRSRNGILENAWTPWNSKSNVLRNTTDSYEESRLLEWSTNIFGPPDLMKLYRVCQICSENIYGMMTFMIST